MFKALSFLRDEAGASFFAFGSAGAFFSLFLCSIKA
jgi:hypothetical protein